ncbi:MAG TPA: MDR family MFS transporter [Acetobacteraceae bacterium]|nr:MDR family MFS transporter [Acetobacteraceae bacterium]
MPEAPLAAVPVRRWPILAACLMATFMPAVESTIVATAMPTIVADLGGFALFSWAFTLYLLTQAVSIPLYGRLADLHGRKPVFFAGAGLFLAGSVLAGFAHGMVALILFRAVQGLGAGGVMPVAATILGDIYAPAERARVQGLVSSVFGVSAVIGPSLGAFLIEHLSWPVVFWVNLPIGAASLVMLGLFLRERVAPRPHRLDIAGSVLLFTAIGGLMLVLVQGAALPGLAWWGAFGCGIAAMVALLVHETRIAEPMLPLELWRDPVIVAGSLGNCATGAVMMGVAAFLPAYVQGAMGRSPGAGGLVLGAMSVSWALASLLAGRIMLRTSYRSTARLGGAALVMGCLMLVALTPARGPLWAGAGSFVIGLGMGFCSTTFIVSIQAAVPWAKRGAATSSAMFLRFVGQALGAAGCGAVLNATLREGGGVANEPLANRVLDGAQRARLPPGELARMVTLLAHGLHNAYLLAAALSVVALALAWLIPRRLSPRHA